MKLTQLPYPFTGYTQATDHPTAEMRICRTYSIKCCPTMVRFACKEQATALALVYNVHLSSNFLRVSPPSPHHRV